MQVRYVKAHGPYAVGDVREAGHDEAIQLLAHGIVEPAGGPEVHKATTPAPQGKRTAAVKH
jgi:hypothetical protein